MGDTEAWRVDAQIGRDALEQSIPRHLISETATWPGEDERNVVRFPELRGVLTPEELEMTSQDVNGLLESYRTGRWTAEAVTLAFLKRAVIGQKLVSKSRGEKGSCLTGGNSSTLRSSSWPSLRSRRQGTSTKLSGEQEPLLGLCTVFQYPSKYAIPSVRDSSISANNDQEHIGIKGRICNAGFVCNMGCIPDEDAHVVQLLKKAGAVIHVRTNQPQAIMVRSPEPNASAEADTSCL